jgi:DNA polymerase III alpha subunit
VRVRLGSSGVSDEATDEAIRLLSSSKLYGFCKSHAMSYAHLSWALAYEKAHNLKSFWEQFIDKVGMSRSREVLGWVEGAGRGEVPVVILIDGFDDDKSACHDSRNNLWILNPDPHSKLSPTRCTFTLNLTP